MAPEVTVESCVVDVVVADVVGVGVVSSSSCFRTSGQRFFLLAVCMVAPAFLAVCVCLKECEMPWRMLCVASLEFSETVKSSQNWKNFECMVLLAGSKIMRN